MMASAPAPASASGGLDRLTRVVVLTSALIALVTEAWLGRPGWAELPVLALSIGLGTAVVSRYRERFAFIPALGTALIAPVLFNVAVGRFLPAFHVLWFAAMLGPVFGARGSLARWSLPPAWRLPLAMWALAIAVSWPIVVMREADFTWAWLTRVHHMANSSLGGAPPDLAIWIINVSLGILCGLLWFDRLFAYADGPEVFLRCAVYPMAVGAFLGCALAAYQGLVDIHFLNGSHWPSINRAGGGTVDGDAFGAAAAWWSTAFLAVAATGGITGVLVGTAGVLVAWAGAWATGSRMALMAALIGTAIAVPYAIRSARVPQRRLRLAAGLVALAAAGSLLLLGRWSTQNPVRRALDDLPKFDRASISHFVEYQLFNRGAPYGTASVWMIKESPLAGTGIGSFNGMLPDYSYRIEPDKVRPNFDNAQSWYRQLFAEMGVMGTTGWLLWAISVGVLLFRTGGSGDTVFAAGAIKGALVALALITTVSLPTQDVFVAQMPWLLVFWYLTLAPDGRARLEHPGLLTRRGAWTIGCLWTVIFAVVTLWEAQTHFRPAFRAVRADWDYSAGFYDPEGTDEGAGGFQWTEGHAVRTVRVKGPWLKLTISGGPDDIAAKPAVLRISRRYKTVVKTLRSSQARATWYIWAGSEPQMIIGIDIDRTFLAPGGDHRQLGVRVEGWTFVDAPPPGAVVLK